ncbi:uncharacterized protein M421DRAFT_73543 [Didymella exigua CBS 183.55]|uniref:Uncharacterized protein n=1 Tax=Didymella exigua CBS 183.55 TaxID=1150837 RepID=A0A6A5RA34_9PLEO|nr:uncharacterized protein M421DRAFT_73543 [Didymella exigua CBS 183.55]KAF1924140.1 hypothetical protein M421DRAFT_73543 [Didymella exigua CBS 183.55]
MSVQQLETVLRRNWRRLDKKAYQSALKRALPPLRRPTNKTTLDRYVEELLAAIKQAVKEASTQDRIEQAAQSPQALWKLASWAKTRGDRPLAVTPAIRHLDTRQEITDPAEKADLF